MGGVCADFGPHRGDGLDVNVRIRQQLADLVQHQAVVVEEVGVIGVLGQYVGAQQNVHRLGCIGCQSLQGDFLNPVHPGAGGAVHHCVGAYPR